MKEMLDAQKVVLKLTAQEVEELIEVERKRIKDRNKLDLVVNAFVGGGMFALFIIALRDGNNAAAALHIFACAYMIWRVNRNWGYDDEPKTTKQ